jgi:uncharacterized ferritin-like protein (DUF455 family)
MELAALAHAVLFGTTLQEKLIESGEISDAKRGPALDAPPRFPGRPERLATIGQSKFPKPRELAEPVARGRVLHFFANHELLAMELMALALLRFPDAPPSFRAGIGRTLREEQSHLRLYIDRMQALGVDFGDLPLSDYFWNAMSSMRSPLDYAVQMSLTLEQANLDFSVYYRDAVAAVGDTETAAILDRVFREEIGHVKHGVVWFNRWRTESAPRAESEWEAYVRLLPSPHSTSPMTPRRAKGPIFCAEARSEAGLSQEYIDELEMHSGSKGRPPSIWIYNPLCDAEIARGRPGLSATKKIQGRIEDLEHLPMFLAGDSDQLLVSKRPRLEWLREIKALGFELPEFLERDKAQLPQKIAGFEPWGWSPETFARFQPLASRLVNASGANSEWAATILAKPDFQSTGLAKLFSKAWSTGFLREWMKRNSDTTAVFGDPSSVGTATDTVTETVTVIRSLLTAHRSVLLKAPWGTSGIQHKKIQSESELQFGHPTHGWITNTLEAQGQLVVEPFLDNVCDLSMQFIVNDDEIRLLEIRRFLTGPRFEYRGTWLGSKMSGFEPEHARLIENARPAWTRLVRDLGTRLRDEGFRGSAGIDALLWKDSRHELRLKPLVELNPRWTMGRVALALEKHLVPAQSALWAFVPRSKLSREELSALKAKHPAKTAEIAGGALRISEGIVCTNDPETCREVQTLLFVGSSVDAAKSILTPPAESSRS